MAAIDARFNFKQICYILIEVIVALIILAALTYYAKAAINDGGMAIINFVRGGWPLFLVFVVASIPAVLLEFGAHEPFHDRPH